MTGEVGWENAEHTILCVNLGVQWNWADFHEIIQQAYAEVRSVSHPVSVLLGDGDQKRDLPDGSPISNFMLEVKQMPDNVNVIVVVLGRRFTRTMLNLLIKMVPRLRTMFVFVSSWEEGRSYYNLPIRESGQQKNAQEE